MVIIISFLIIICPALVYSWDGYDYEADNYIEIKNKDLIIPGNDIEIYDYSDEAYHEVYVMSIHRNGVVIIEVFDYDDGDYREFEMIDESKMKQNI